MTKVAVVFADGFEEIEALSPVEDRKSTRLNSSH